MKKYVKPIAAVSHRKLEDGETEITLKLEHGVEFTVYAHEYDFRVPTDIPYRIPGFDFSIKPGKALTLTYDPKNPRTAHIAGSHEDWVKMFAFRASTNAQLFDTDQLCAHGEICNECGACWDLEVHMLAREDAEENKDSGTLYWLRHFKFPEKDDAFFSQLYAEERE